MGTLRSSLEFKTVLIFRFWFSAFVFGLKTPGDRLRTSILCFRFRTSVLCVSLIHNHYTVFSPSSQISTVINDKYHVKFVSIYFGFVFDSQSTGVVLVLILYICRSWFYNVYVYVAPVLYVSLWLLYCICFLMAVILSVCVVHIIHVPFWLLYFIILWHYCWRLFYIWVNLPMFYVTHIGMMIIWYRRHDEWSLFYRLYSIAPIFVLVA